MTDLIERPVAPRTPVNSYDPNMGSFTENLHDMIRHDLSTIGQVYNISGTMLHTRRHGMIAEDVKAYIESPHFCIPIIIDIAWDEDKEEIVYRNAMGRRFIPRGAGYDDDVINEHEKDVFDKAVSGINAHAAITTRAEWRKNNPYPTHKTQALMVAAPGATTMVGSGAYVLLADPTNLLAAASVPVMIGAGILGNRRLVRNAKKQYETHRQATQIWNEDRRSVLMNTMSLEEQSVFVDALLTLCERSGVEYHGELMATKTSVTAKHGKFEHNRFYTEPQYNMATLRGAAVRFKGRLTKDDTPGEILFDGKYLYVPSAGNEAEGRATTISPI